MKKLIIFLLLIPALSFGQGSGTIVRTDKYPVMYAVNDHFKYEGIVISEEQPSLVERPLPVTSKPYAQIWGYLEHVPNPGKLPLLIALTGFGENTASMNGRTTLGVLSNTGIGKLIKQNKFPVDSFIVLLPQNTNSYHYYDVEPLKKFIDYACKTYNVDTTRIYITGLSGGAISLYNYLRKYKCTAAITCAGSGSTKYICTSTVRTPIWATHGANDLQVKPGPDKTLQKAYNACNPKELMKLDIWPGMTHNCWDYTYSRPEFYYWLLSHRN